tara:strand:- start:875 stop:1738 length:864 start_codon:yes stop_codon:yes gene_type:complete
MGYVGNQTTTAYTSMTKQVLTGVTGDPVKRGFTLTHAVANAQEIEVFVNNVRQEPTTSYTASGTALTMTGDVETTDNFYIVFQGKAVGTVTPPDGSVGTAKIADGAVSTAKISDGSVTTAKLQSGATFNPITNLQIFRVNADISSTTSATIITAYHDAHGIENFKRVGTAWSVSSGVFTPSVSGLYEITFVASMSATSNNRYVQIDFHFSTDSGSSFTTEDHYTSMSHSASSWFKHVTFPRYYNITNASATRFKVGFQAEGTNVTLRGSASVIRKTCVIFKRIADAQ